MKGRVQYTQHTVAFPLNPQTPRVVEDLSVSLAARGGGTHSEFMIQWYDLTDEAYARLSVFAIDGLEAMLDPRVLPVIRWLKNKNPTPEQVIRRLEKHGARPSAYHIRGLLEKHPPHDERMRLLDLQREARNWEEGT